MPSRISIPRRHLPVLAVLRDLGEDHFKQLADAIRARGVMLRAIELKEAIRPVVADRADAMAEVLFALALLRRAPRSGAQVLALVRSALESETEGGWTAQQLARWSEVAPRIAAILDIEGLVVLGKAVALEYEHQNIVSTVHIITDARPIFNDAGTEVKATLIVHELRLEYQSDGVAHSLSLALDGKDIQALSDECQRARIKGRTLTELLGRNVPVRAAGEQE